MNKVNYLEQLTWLRGFAAFTVIISHVLRATETSYTADDTQGHNIFLSFLDLGNFGVVLFFTLSGTTLYLSNSQKIIKEPIFHFYIKRFFRVWPAFFVSLILYILFGFFFSYFYIEPTGAWIEEQFLSPYSFKDVFFYALFLFNLTGDSGLFNNAYWSLPVEFEYYLIFPFLIASLKFGWGTPLFIGAFLYFIPKLGIFPEYLENLFFLAFSFCGGVAVGFFNKNRGKKFKYSTALASCLLLLLLILASAIRHHYFNISSIPLLSRSSNSYCLIAIASVYICLNSKFVFYKPIMSFLTHYGSISYSLYLYHNLLIGLIVLILLHFEVNNGDFRLFITLFFTLGSSLYVANASYKYIELPFIRLGRNLIT